jgi:hypothetical protein
MLMLKEVAIMKFRSQDGSRPKFKTDSQTIDYNGGAPGLKKEKTLVKWDEHAPGPENGLEGGEEKVLNSIFISRTNHLTSSKSSRAGSASSPPTMRILTRPSYI